MKYIPIIGLEVHCQLKTKSKVFCRCPNRESEEPNVDICPICTGQPGVLPKLNKKALEAALKVALALNCKIAPVSEFARKHYFYPDLPKNFQISQYNFPLGENGFLLINNEGKEKIIRIQRVHLEEDTAKLLHSPDGEYSLVDFNRAGSPLLEIVTAPDINSPAEAKFFVQQLQILLRYLGVSDADMEKGHLRVDANISLKKANEKKLGTKTEIKNLNSFRALERALAYEIERQREILEEGGKIIQETRGWNESKQKTIPQRFKEEVSDYRYFREPDLPLIKIDSHWVLEIRKGIGELPWEKKQRFETEYQLNPADSFLLIADLEVADFFEATVSELSSWVKTSGIKNISIFQLAKIASSWIKTEIFKFLNEKKITISQLNLTPENFAEFLTLILKGTISQLSAKKIFQKMIEEGKDPSVILEEEGLHLISDTETLESLAKEVIKENPKAVEDYKKGKTEALKFLVGQIMKKTKGAADPKLAAEVLEKEIK